MRRACINTSIIKLMKEYITPTYIHTQEKDRVSEMGDRERPIDVESQRECMRHRDR